MRADMCQVVTERPRRGSSNRYGYVRRRENRACDLDDLPKTQGMRRPFNSWTERKDFTDVLGPWNGYLRKQVGRKWDDVFSEICESLSSYVARHIVKEHLNVELNVEKINGIVYSSPETYRWYNGERARVAGLYVDPETGILCDGDGENVTYFVDPRPKPVDYKELVADIRKSAVRVKGIWYRAKFLPVPGARRVYRPGHSWRISASKRPSYMTESYEYPEVFCVAQNRNVSASHNDTAIRDGDRNPYYVAEKWQMNSKELRRHGLVNVAPLFKE